MLWDLDRSIHQRNYFPNCAYGTGNFECCGCLSRHFTWLGVMRIPSVVAAWIRHVRACAPAGHVTVDIGLLKNAKFQGGFKKWMPFSHLSQILYELERNQVWLLVLSLQNLALVIQAVFILALGYASCKRWPVCITRARFCRESTRTQTWFLYAQ